MKKRGMAASAAVASSMLLVACASGVGNTGESGDSAGAVDGVTIDFGIHVADPQEQEPAFYAVVEAFEDANPNIHVNLIGKEQSEHIKAIKMQSQSGTLPDMFWILQASAEELQKADALMDLSPFLEENPEIANSLQPNMIAAFNVDGDQYGLPFQPLVTGMFVNRALFEEFGLELPATFEDLANAAKVFNENGIVTIAQGAKDPYSVWAFLTMMSRFGYFDKIDQILAGDEKWDNADFVRFYEKVDELARAGAFPTNVATQSYFQAVESFLDGRAAILDSGAWDIQKIEDSDLKDDVTFWWGPTFADGVGDQMISSVVPSAPIVVNTKVAEDGAKRAAVEKFLQFYYSTDGIQVMVDNHIPPMSNLDVSADEAEHPVFASVMEAVQSPDYTSQPAQPDLVVSEAVANAIYDSIYGVINGTYAPTQAAQVVQSAVDSE